MRPMRRLRRRTSGASRPNNETATTRPSNRAWRRSAARWRARPSRCSQKATSERRVFRETSLASQASASANTRQARRQYGIELRVASGAHQGADDRRRRRRRSSTAPAAIGHRDLEAASSAAKAAIVPSAPRRRGALRRRIRPPTGWKATSEKLAASVTPPTKAPINRMLGSAMRRFRVKNSASAQLAAAGPRAAGMIQRPPDAPATPSASSDMRSAMATKISLKPVSSRKDSSSRRRRRPPPLDEHPKFRRRADVHRAGDDSGIEIFVVELQRRGAILSKRVVSKLRQFDCRRRWSFARA